MRVYIIITFIFFLSHSVYGKEFHHKVKWGDTLYSIGKRYNLSYKRLLLLNPNIKKNNLKAGTKLRVSSSGIGIHKVSKGETLWSIAREYSLSILDIRRLNRLSNEDSIFAGQDILVFKESGRLPGQSFKTVVNKNILFWPANGKLLKSYGRYDHLFSASIKIKTISDIRSSLRGKVTFVGKMRGYGNTIIISHPNGLLTMYCSDGMKPLVSLGDFVKSKEIIATKKNKHLIFDFYVWSGNIFVNPVNYLKRTS